jgi:hypothetical protein
MHPERMPSGLSSLIAGRQQLANRNPPCTLAKLQHAREGFIDLFLTRADLGHDPSDAAYLVQELGKMNFGFGCLNLAHRSTSRFDQSYYNVVVQTISAAQADEAVSEAALAQLRTSFAFACAPQRV